MELCSGGLGGLLSFQFILVTKGYLVIKLAEGIITLHDLTESIFGDILEENETEEEEIVVRQDGSMLVEASMNLDDFMEAMGIMNYDDLKEEDFTTLSGLAMFLIGRVPKAGDLFSYKNLDFEVVDMDRGRVDKLLVIKKEEDE